jgi:hypothetical protein
MELPMSTSTERDLAELRARMKAQTEFAGEHGEAWLRKLEGQFAGLPNGTIIVINCRTGEYVLGQTRLGAADEFERRFGKEIGYVHEIGGGIFAGAGGGIV